MFQKKDIQVEALPQAQPSVLPESHSASSVSNGIFEHEVIDDIIHQSPEPLQNEYDDDSYMPGNFDDDVDDEARDTVLTTASVGEMMENAQNAMGNANESPTDKKKEIVMNFFSDLKKSLDMKAKPRKGMLETLLKLVFHVDVNMLMLHVALLVFYFFANIPKLHFEKLLKIFDFFLPPIVKNFLSNTSRTFFSEFVSQFWNITAEKLDCPSGKGCILVFDIEKLLQEKIKSATYRKDWWEGICSICTSIAKKSWETVLKDVNDGQFMVDWNRKHLFNDICTPFQMFIDGVQPFQGSREVLVPFFLTNLQMDIEKRFDLGNMTLCAMLSTKAPDIDYKYFLETVVPKLNAKFESFKMNLNGKEYACSAEVINTVMDISEKEKALMHSSGFFGCDQCDTKGVYNEKVHFPEKGNERTPNSLLLDQSIAERMLSLNKKKSFRGVKGKSILCSLKGLTFPFSNTIDPMHTCDLGVQKMMLECWMGKNKNFKTFKLKKKIVSEINSNLDDFKICDSFSRRPRSLLEIGLWKADEFKCFFLCYFPVMEKYLDKKYFSHAMLYVRWYKIISGKIITISQFEHANNLLEEFRQGISTLYGEYFFTKKVHYVIYHLMPQIQRFGPPAQFSSKRYEDKNGELMRLNYGKYEIEQQLIEKTNLPHIIETAVSSMEIEKNSSFYNLLGCLGYPPFKKEIRFWKNNGIFSYKVASDTETQKILSLKSKLQPHLQKFLEEHGKSLITKIHIDKTTYRCFETQKRNSTFCLSKIKEKYFICKIRYFFFNSIQFFVCLSPCFEYDITKPFLKQSTKSLNDVVEKVWQFENIDIIIDEVVILSMSNHETYFVPVNLQEPAPFSSKTFTSNFPTETIFSDQMMTDLMRNEDLYT